VPVSTSKFDCFLSLFKVLGIGSAVALLSAITTVIWDEFPTVKYWKIAAAACSTGFLLGICYVTPGGQWMLNLIDHFGGTFLVFAMAILEMLAIFYVYGIDNFCDDIEFMLKWKPTTFWRVSWRFVTPGIMIVIFIYYMSVLETPTYGGWMYPTGYMALGWVVFALGFLQLPFWIVWFLVRKRKLPLGDRVKEGASPTADWGPKNPEEYSAWVLYKTEAQKKRADAAPNQSRSVFAKIWAVLQANLGRNRNDRV
jgi:solute carrier family 6 (neurotransmitter transporter, glycine) member 5/9